MPTLSPDHKLGTKLAFQLLHKLVLYSLCMFPFKFQSSCHRLVCVCFVKITLPHLGHVVCGMMTLASACFILGLSHLLSYIPRAKRGCMHVYKAYDWPTTIRLVILMTVTDSRTGTTTQASQTTFQTKIALTRPVRLVWFWAGYLLDKSKENDSGQSGVFGECPPITFFCIAEVLVWEFYCISLTCIHAHFKAHRTLN